MNKTTNILIDCSHIEESWLPSNSLVIYVVRLIRGFLEYSHYQVHILLWRDKVELINDLVGDDVEKIVLDRDDIIIGMRPFYKLSGYLPSKLKHEIKRREISIVLHPFHYWALFIYPHNIRYYGVLHDMFFYDRMKEEKGWFSYFLWHWYQKILLGKFTGLISISKKTHDEFLQREHINSDIVYNCISSSFKVDEQQVGLIFGKKYILNVNRINQSKNPVVLLRAFALLKDKVSHILYFKCDSGFAEYRLSLETLVRELGIEDRVIFDMEYRTEGEMRYLYSHADLFVSPSLKEGFGWTPIEAAILKTPVLVSNIEVFREVSCNKLTTFDPHSPEDLAKHILDTLNNPSSEKERDEISKFFLERYSLKNQIEQLVSIMERDLKK